MNRRSFFKQCSSGACACAAASAFAPVLSTAAEPAAPDDWRIQFVQARYGKLLEFLGAELGEASLDGTLRKLGQFCASGLPLIAQHKGDVDGFIREFSEKAGEAISYDRATQTITVVGPERDGCFCPLVNAKTCPKSVCSCSLGWQQHVYESLIGKPVKVTLKESVVRGGKRCIFEIQVQKETTS